LRLANALGSIDRQWVALISAAVILLIGLADFVSGTLLSFGAVYAVPIAAAAWFVSAPFAFALSLLSVTLWLSGDLAAVGFESPLTPIWNGTLRFGSYCIFVTMVSGLHRLQTTLEARVAERTAALTHEIEERERLERELLGISDREQRRLGQDLHDSLCQHLTATALAGQVLAESLAAKNLPEEERANDVVDLIEEAIAQSRNLARGLNPVELHGGGLPQALEGFANTTTQLFNVNCTFQRRGGGFIEHEAAAGQLYRIAQEAVSNAVKHGNAKNITILLAGDEHATTLTIEDDGSGVPEPPPRTNGMGLHIMSHRANIAGGTFAISRKGMHGTLVRCTLPRAAAMGEVNYA
jgi:signal transduction histidine kinase